MNKNKNKRLQGQPVISEDIKEQVQKLVKARLMAVPKHIEIAIGSKQYSRDELLRFIDENNEIGQQLMEMQIEYLRDLATGKIYAKDSNE